MWLTLLGHNPSLTEIKAGTQRKNMKASLVAVLSSITSDQGTHLTAKEVEQDPGRILLAAGSHASSYSASSLVQFRTTRQPPQTWMAAG